MARNATRRYISRQLQNERRKAQTRVKRLRSLAKQTTDSATAKALRREAKNLQQRAKRWTSRGKSIEQAKAALSRARHDVATPSDTLTRFEMRASLDQSRGIGQFSGMSEHDIRAMWKSVSDYTRGTRPEDRMESIREGLEDDYGVKLDSDAEVWRFVQRTRAYWQNVTQKPVDIDIDTTEDEEFQDSEHEDEDYPEYYTVSRDYGLMQ